MRKMKLGATLAATVIVDGPDGAVHLCVEGRIYVVSGALRRGLQDCAHENAWRNQVRCDDALSGAWDNPSR